MERCFFLFNFASSTYRERRSTFSVFVPVKTPAQRMEIKMNTSRNMNRDGDGVPTPDSNGEGGLMASLDTIAAVDDAALGERGMSLVIEENRTLKERNAQLEQRIREQEERNKQLEQRIRKQEERNAQLEQRIREQEDTICRLNVQLEKQTMEIERRFTLAQVVDYCINGVEWGDAKEIVNMMNVLLRGNATQEDYALLDSVRDNFKNKKYGNTYIKEQTVIPNVGNYKPQIQTQHVEQPTPHIVEQEQDLLE